MYSFISRVAIIGLLICSSALAGESRGYRNHNPGNIVKTDIQWQGEVECDDPKFECFISNRSGIRAIVRILDVYYDRHRLRTIPELIKRWEYGGIHKGATRPDETTISNNYSNFVSDGVGMVCGVRYWDVISRVVRRMIKFENGYVEYYSGIDSIVANTLPDKINHKWRC